MIYYGVGNYNEVWLYHWRVLRAKFKDKKQDDIRILVGYEPGAHQARKSTDIVVVEPGEDALKITTASGRTYFCKVGENNIHAEPDAELMYQQLLNTKDKTVESVNDITKEFLTEVLGNSMPEEV